MDDKFGDKFVVLSKVLRQHDPNLIMDGETFVAQVKEQHIAAFTEKNAARWGLNCSFESVKDRVTRRVTGYIVTVWR